jgi:CHAD domain-containing protein
VVAGARVFRENAIRAISRSMSILDPQVRHVSAHDSLVDLIDRLAEHLRAPLEDDPERVHAARVATRRLHAHLDVLESLLPRKKARRLHRALRRARRRLGPLRDLDVALAGIPGLDGAEGAPVAHLRQHLERRRQRALARFPPEERLRLAERIEGCADVGAPLLDEDQPLRELTQAAVAHRAALLVGAAEATPPSPHAVRVAAKRLRYSLEIERVAGTDRAVAVDEALAALRRVQDALGAWHDHTVRVSLALALLEEERLALTDAPAAHGVLSAATGWAAAASVDLERFAGLWTAARTAVSRLTAPYSSTQPRRSST